MYWFLFFNLNPQGGITTFPVSETRIMGVLQRIALCHGMAALLVHYFKTRTAAIIGAAIHAAVLVCGLFAPQKAYLYQGLGITHLMFTIATEKSIFISQNKTPHEENTDTAGCCCLPGHNAVLLLLQKIGR
jgi:predicted acyltransferase